MKKHVWKKKGNPDRQAAQLVRSWVCRACGATKVTVKRTADVSPRPTIERRVSSEVCDARG